MFASMHLFIYEITEKEGGGTYGAFYLSHHLDIGGPYLPYKIFPESVKNFKFFAFRCGV